ncbi:hypothetical protein PYCC9005_001400 [Savitreella phatthalungensis]
MSLRRLGSFKEHVRSDGSWDSATESDKPRYEGGELPSDRPMTSLAVACFPKMPTEQCSAASEVDRAALKSARADCRTWSSRPSSEPSRYSYTMFRASASESDWTDDTVFTGEGSRNTTLRHALLAKDQRPMYPLQRSRHASRISSKVSSNSACPWVLAKLRRSRSDSDELELALRSMLRKRTPAWLDQPADTRAQISMLFSTRNASANRDRFASIDFLESMRPGNHIDAGARHGSAVIQPTIKYSRSRLSEASSIRTNASGEQRSVCCQRTGESDPLQFEDTATLASAPEDMIDLEPGIQVPLTLRPRRLEQVRYYHSAVDRLTAERDAAELRRLSRFFVLGFLCAPLWVHAGFFVAVRQVDARPQSIIHCRSRDVILLNRAMACLFTPAVILAVVTSAVLLRGNNS